MKSQPRAVSRPGERRNKGRLLTLAAWLLLVGVIALVVNALPAAAAGESSCVPRRGISGQAKPDDQLGEFYVSDKRFRMQFKESHVRKAETRMIQGYTKTPRNLTARLDDVLTGTQGQDDITANDVHVVAAVVQPAMAGKPAIVSVCVQVDPGAIANLQPGHYDGSIVLSADNYRDSYIPIVLTFRGSRNTALILAFGGVLLGLFLKLGADSELRKRSKKPHSEGAEHSKGGLIPDFSRFLPAGVVIAIAAALVGGLLGFVEIYNANATWGAASTDWLKLFGTCFGFQMGSFSGVDIAKRFIGSDTPSSVMSST
ncbi:MAG TPA: hypothetical protein VF101_01115 [Gaiellaceae bacterium]